MIEKIPRVLCEDVIFYLSNPLELRGAICVAGAIREFVEERLYPMPDFAQNPLCWNQRCDYIWTDFWELHGCVLGSKQETESAFWSTVRQWLPGVVAFKFVDDASQIKEQEINGTRTKKLYFWKEYTYELRKTGYSGRPTNPWKEEKEE